MGDMIEELRYYIERDVAMGFLPVEAIAESAVEQLAHEYEPVELRVEAQRLTREAIESHLHAQAAWPSVTDCDRLDRAFEDLDRSGIVSRQHFTCCGTCGVAEILDEVDAAASTGTAVRGYVFYHAQDTEHAIEGSGVFLNFGSTAGDTAADRGIAAEIIATLERHGLPTKWKGDTRSRIGVPLDWKRRRRRTIA